MKLKPDAGRAQLVSVPITEDRLIWSPRLSAQMSHDQPCGFWPQWANPFLASLPKEQNVSR
jgi:hypothetical protein